MTEREKIISQALKEHADIVALAAELRKKSTDLESKAIELETVIRYLTSLPLTFDEDNPQSELKTEQKTDVKKDVRSLTKNFVEKARTFTFDEIYTALCKELPTVHEPTLRAEISRLRTRGIIDKIGHNKWQVMGEISKDTNSDSDELPIHTDIFPKQAQSLLEELEDEEIEQHGNMRSENEEVSPFAGSTT